MVMGKEKKFMIVGIVVGIAILLSAALNIIYVLRRRMFFWQRKLGPGRGSPLDPDPVGGGC